MWIKDHYGRIINADNVVHLDVVDANKDKENTNPSWVVAGRILKTDWSNGSIIYLTDKMSDKKEVEMRLDTIIEGIVGGAVFLELE